MRSNKESMILVELKEPHYGKTKFLFGSKRAIYRLLPPSVVGIGYSTLLCKHNLQEPYSNEKCTITRLPLYRTATNRGKNE